MLESMRKHAQGWLSKVLLAGIILSFALWGIGDYFTGNKVETVAEVDGEAIFDVEFAETYRRQLANYANMLGKDFTKELAERLGVKEETIQTMVNRKLMLMEANHMGLTAPDEAILATVQTTPQFTEPGKGFSAARYQALIRQMGFPSTRDYENYLRQSIIIEGLQQSISNSAVISDAEVKARFEKDFEHRVLAAIIINPDSLKADVKVSEDEAKTWYEDHAASYQSPLKVSVDVVDINKETLMKDLSVSDDEIGQAYEEHQSEFTVAEKRSASHILVRVNRDAAEDVKQQAQEKILAAKKRIDGGESFATVAKDVSDDVTSNNGGDLGFFARGAMVPEFEEEVFDKLEVGEVSSVVQTQFGLHLIKLNEIQDEKVQSLAKVKELLRTRLLIEKAGDEAFKMSNDLDDALGSEGSLKAAATRMNTPVKELKDLTNANIAAQPLIANAEELKNKVFSASPGDAVEIVEVENGHFVALEVVARNEPSTMAFEEVVNRVYDDARNFKAANEAQKLADKILVLGEQGKSADALAQEFGQAKFISKPVRSNGEGDSASWIGAVLPSSFRTPVGHWANQAMSTTQGIALVFVQDVQKADAALFAEQEATIRDEVKQAKGAVRFASFMASVRDRHDIQVHQRVMNRF